MSQYEFDGEPHVSLNWKMDGGAASASPAARYFASDDVATTTAEIMKRLHEGLALPGTPSDYHFAVQRAIDSVWKRRHQDAEAAEAAERLCLLDLELVEVYPDHFRTHDHFYAMTSTRLVVELYEGAGDLDAALAAARRAEPFLNGTGDVARLEEKARAEAEEGAP